MYRSIFVLQMHIEDALSEISDNFVHFEVGTDSMIYVLGWRGKYSAYQYFHLYLSSLGRWSECIESICKHDCMIATVINILLTMFSGWDLHSQ